MTNRGDAYSPTTTNTVTFASSCDADYCGTVSKTIGSNGDLLNVSKTPIQDYAAFKTIATLTSADYPREPWQVHAVSSVALPYSTRILFRCALLLEILNAVKNEKPWKYVKVICKMSLYAPYIKTHPINPWKDLPASPLMKEMSDMFRREFWLIQILQCYSGYYTKKKGWRCNDVHNDLHDGYEKLLLREDGPLNFYATYLGLGAETPFLGINCEARATVTRGTDEALGLVRFHGNSIKHSGGKQPDRPQLLIQLRPDGETWPKEKKFTDDDCLVILKRYELFVAQKVVSIIPKL